jgi:cold shock protein
MNFTDTWATDENGEQFIFTVEMQRRLSEAGLPVEPAYISQLTTQAPEARDRRPAPAPRQSYQPTPAPRTEPQRRDEPAAVIEEPETIQIDPETGKYLGRMKWYNPARGYGFIARGGGQDIFFHKSASLGDPQDLQEGQWVLYDVEEKKKGPEATEVEPYEGNLLE